MKQHTVWLSDETTEVVEGLAAEHTGGNFSAMICEVVNKTVLRTDCEVYQRQLETLLRAKEATPMQIIGIAGRAGSGKSEVARMVRDLVLPRKAWGIAFADELKAIASDEFGWDGKKDERGRRLLQVLGTDCGRAYDPQIWVKRWRDELYEVNESFRPDYIIADDVRFENEAAEIHRMGGVVVRVNRPIIDGVTDCPPDDHVSEQPLPQDCIDYTIRNDGTLEQLRGLVDLVLREIGKDGE